MNAGHNGPEAHQTAWPAVTVVVPDQNPEGDAAWRIVPSLDDAGTLLGRRTGAAWDEEIARRGAEADDRFGQP